MCIIVYKPSGVKPPKLSTLINCQEANPMGVGIMLREEKAIDIYKGLYDIEDMYDLFKEVLLDESREYAIHFRLATHGSTSAGNCHPFPILKGVKSLKRTALTTDMALMHNGIISLPRSIERGDKQLDCSDTMSYIRHRLMPYRGNLCERLDKIAYETLGSKLLIFGGDGAVMMTGEWEEDGGIYYSNDGYKPYSSRYYMAGRNDRVRSLPIVDEETPVADEVSEVDKDFKIHCMECGAALTDEELMAIGWKNISLEPLCPFCKSPLRDEVKAPDTEEDDGPYSRCKCGYRFTEEDWTRWSDDASGEWPCPDCKTPMQEMWQARG